MEQTTQESKKNLSFRLANLIMSGSKDEKQITALKQELGLDAAPQAASPGKKAGNRNDERIVGVWKPHLVKGQEFYVRDPQLTGEYPKWANSFQTDNWMVAIIIGLIPAAIFAAKVVFILFVFIWVRWTLPRFRYDQIMKLGWKYLMPLALANIFFVGVVLILYQMWSK